MMPTTQADALLSQHGATFVTTKDGIDWWKAADGYWLAKKFVAPGYVELRRLSPEACNC